MFHAAGRRERKPSHRTSNGWPVAHNGSLRQSTVCLVLVERMLMLLDRRFGRDSDLRARRALTSKACLSLDALPVASEADGELVGCNHVTRET